MTYPSAYKLLPRDITSELNFSPRPLTKTYQNHVVNKRRGAATGMN
jgi:hypothetical protein